METHKRKRILITDGGSVNALAAVRYLGQASFNCVVVAYNGLAISKYSKYCQVFFQTEHPKKNPNGFYATINKIIIEQNIDFVLPVGFYAHKVLVENKIELEKITKLCLPSLKAFEIATSKILTTQLAEQIGVKVPKTTIVKNIEELSQLSHLRFPVVIKSQKEIGGRMLAYANSEQELQTSFKNMVRQHQLSSEEYPIIQEYITGKGVGYFAFCKQGEIRAEFMHERLREFPVSGGRSVCAVAIQNENLAKSGRAVLKALTWNGAAMVEFKQTKEGEFYLLEVNPKLWGSLELALAAGVNFPLLMINDAFGSTNEKMPDYKKDLVFQWLLNGELYYLANRPWKIFSVIGAMFQSKKDFWIKDIKPNLMQGFLVFVDLYKYFLAALRK